jgi:hypothetical protein
MYDCELARGLLEREETPPSLQALELAIISWRQLAHETEKISSQHYIYRYMYINIR